MHTKRNRPRKRKTRRGGTDVYMGMGIMVALFGMLGPFVMRKIPSASACKKKEVES